MASPPRLLPDIGAYQIPILTVTDPGNGPGSANDVTLPYAVANAQNGYLIAFASSLSGDTITLSSTLTLNANVSIYGLGAANLAVSGNNAVAVFNVGSGANVTIQGVTIEHGVGGNGGGIVNSGTLTLTNDTITANTASGTGGGIYSSGSLTLTGGTISGNVASGSGSGIVTTANNNLALTGTSTTTISDNIASKNGGSIVLTGAGPFNLTGNVNIGSGTFDNQSTGNVTVSGAISGSGSLDMAGLGTLTLTGVNTYSGSTTVGIPGASTGPAGTLQISGSGDLGSGNYAGNIVLNGTLLSACSVNQFLCGPLTLAGPSTIGATAVGTTLTVTGNVALSSTTLTVVGAGSTVINGNITGQAGPVASGLIDGNFTTPSQNGGYNYDPTGSAWTFIGAPSFKRTASAWGYPNTPSGAQTASLQDGSTSNLDYASISQTFNWPAGIDTISFYVCRRPGYGNLPVNVQVNGTTIYTVSTIPSSWTLYTTTFFVATAGSETLTFTTPPMSGGDYDTGLSGVSVIALQSGILKNGTGTLTLSNDNTASLGSTTIDAGTLIATVNGAMGPANAGGIIVNSGGALAFSGGINYSTAEPMTITGSGPAGNGAIDNLSGSNSFAGAISLVAGPTVTATTGTTLTLGGTISGTGGLIVGGGSNSGTLVLSGTSTYSGTTTLDSGTLEVDGFIADSSTVTVSSGATLDGTGAVGSAVVDGSVDPGNATHPTGTLTASAANFSAGGNYTAMIAGASASNLLSLTGGLTLGGSSTLTVNLAGLTTPAAVTITSDDGSRVGQFSSFNVLNNTNGYQVAVSYTTHTVVVTAAPSLSVTTNATSIPNYTSPITITGTAFSPTTGNDTVTFDNGVSGSVIAATTTSLTVALTTPPGTHGNLDAIVTVAGVGPSSNTEVASLTSSTVNTNTTNLPNNASTITIGGTFGFGTTAANDSVSFNLGAVGTVSSAGNFSLTVTFTTDPTATGSLFAVVTDGGEGVSSSTQVATVTAPSITTNTSSLAHNASTITIAGSGFSTTTSNDTVIFNDGAVGSVTAATATSLTVAFSTEPTALGSLTAVVTVTGVGVSNSTQVATVVPVVTTNTAGLLQYDTTMTIAGYGFDTITANDSVIFTNGGVTGSVTAASSTSLTVSLTGLSGVADSTALDASVTVDTVSSGSAQQVATVQTSFGVNSATLTPGGVVLLFNAPIAPNTPVLYSSPGDTTYGAADITLVGSTGNAVRGSLVIDPTNPDEATFVETSGLLQPDTYTLTVTSAVKAVGGYTLSGNYTAALTVATTTTPVVSSPSFSRGPGQSVALSNSVGIPISISNATNVTQASFTLTYDPTLLTITNVTAATGLTVQSDNTTIVDAHHWILTVTMSGSASFTTIANQLATITASVPDAAPYQDKSVLNLGNVVVNSAPASGVSGVEAVAYLGDVLGTGVPNATDASLVDQVGSGAGTGFSTFKDLDPSIIAGVDGGSFVNATDASLINEAASGASIAQIPAIPPLPVGTSLITGGPDPYLYLSAVQGAPGQTVTETLYLDVTDPNGIQLTALDEAIGFDAGVLRISNIRSAAGLAGLGSYGTASTVDNTSGVLLAGQAFMGTGLPPVVPYGTDVAVLQFDVTLNSDVAPGAVTGLTLLQNGTINGQVKYTAISDNEGALTWTPGMAPSNSGNAAIDGSVTVVPVTIPVVAEPVVTRIRPRSSLPRG